MTDFLDLEVLELIFLQFDGLKFGKNTEILENFLPFLLIFLT